MMEAGKLHCSSDYPQDKSTYHETYKAALQKAIDFGIQFKPELSLDYIASRVYMYGENIGGILPTLEKLDLSPVKFNRCKYVENLELIKTKVRIGQLLEFDYWLSDNDIDLGVLVGIELMPPVGDDLGKMKLGDEDLSFLVVAVSEIYAKESSYEDLSSNKIESFKDRCLFHPTKPKFAIGQLVRIKEGCKAVILGVKWRFQVDIDDLIRNPEQAAKWAYFVYSWDFEENVMIDIIGLVDEEELEAA